MTTFYVGTAGWSYLTWDKEFYPRGTKPSGKLGYYASRFNAVELNNTFYRLPAPEQFPAWDSQVPETFRFAVKAPQYITHIKRLQDATDTLPELFVATQLQEKRGPILFQLPPKFPPDFERLEKFLKALPGFRRYAIELREPRWHTERLYTLLKQHKVAFCLYDTPEGISPHTLTADFAYVRLRGREDANLKGFLQEWRGWLSDHTHEAYVFFDNREQKNLAFGNALLFRELAEG